MKKCKIFFRADGHAKMGLGHVVRSLALADMLKDDFECHFIIRNPLPTLQEQILEICESIIVLPDTHDGIKEAMFIMDNHLTGEEIVVLDGYHFVTEYQQVFKKKGCKVVCIDDIHGYHFVADVVINHAGGARKEAYSAEPYTQFYLGLEYALLRKPFRQAAQNKIYPDRKDNDVFICLGGADPHNDTLKVLKECEQIQKNNLCYLVIGDAYIHKEALDDFLKESKLEVKLLSKLNAEDMAFYMKKCGKAITPPSSVSIEYLSVGGELYLRVIADNQYEFYQFCMNNQIAYPFNQFGRIDLSQKKRKSVILDGLQGNRFINIFKQISKYGYQTC